MVGLPFISMSAAICFHVNESTNVAEKIESCKQERLKHGFLKVLCVTYYLIVTQSYTELKISQNLLLKQPFY
jgi:hypothetical protein